MLRLVALAALLLLPGLVRAASLEARREAAWRAHLEGDDIRAVVELQDILWRTSRPPHLGRVRRAATADLTAVLALGALAEDPLGSFTRLPRRERQDALLDLAAAAHDLGQPGLAAGAARAAVEADPDSVFAPVGLALLGMVHRQQGELGMALAALEERRARFGVGSRWAAQSPAHAAMAREEEEETTAELRELAMALHWEGLRAQARESNIAWQRRPPREPDPLAPIILDCGSVDHAPVYTTIRAQARGFYACVERARVQRPDLQGTLSLRFTVMPDGSIRDELIQSDTLGDAEAAACVLDRLGKITFPPMTLSLLIVRFPLVFPLEATP